MSTTSTSLEQRPESRERGCSEDPASRGRDLSLLMLAFNFPPATNVGVHRTLRFAKYLGQFGCQPTILTRHCEIQPGGDKLLAQIPARVSIYRVGTSPEPPAEAAVRRNEGDLPNASVRGRLKRTLKGVLRPAWELVTETPDQYISWSRLAAAKALEICRDQPFDAIYTTGPPHSTHLAGLRVRRATRLPWIADFRDPWARRPWSKSRNRWGQRLLPYWERRVVREASCVVLNNDASTRDFREVYPWLPAEKFVTIPNGYDPDLIGIVEELRSRRRSDRGLVNPVHRTPVLCHPGTLYGERDPRPILEAIARLHRAGTDVQFQQIGFVSPRFDPRAIAEELGIQQLVDVEPPVPHQEVMERMADAEMLLVIQPNGPLMVPGKLYEMLLFDQPIVAVCDSVATAEVVDSAGRAVTAASANAEAIQAAIAHCLGMVNSDLQMQTRQKARAAFDGRSLTGQLADRLQQILARC